MKTNPFDYVNSITHNKHNLMRGSDDDERLEKEYNPYMINRAMSLYPDTILYANAMNERHGIPNRAQYEFYLNGIRQKKRFAKWPKEEKDEDIDMVCELYQCNRTRGKEILKLLNPEQIKAFRKRLHKGGVKNG